MNRRSFLGSLFLILPGAGRLWRPNREILSPVDDTYRCVMEPHVYYVHDEVILYGDSETTAALLVAFEEYHKKHTVLWHENFSGPTGLKLDLSPA